MNKYERYVVVGSRRLVEHSYNLAIGSREALRYAVDCADHFTMQGRVFGEDRTGARTLVYVSTKGNSKEEAAKTA